LLNGNGRFICTDIKQREERDLQTGHLGNPGLLDCIWDRSVNQTRTCPASVTPPVGGGSTLRKLYATPWNPWTQVETLDKKQGNVLKKLETPP